MFIEPFKRENEEILSVSFSCSPMLKKKVVAGFTTRNGGFSNPPYSTFNLGLHVNDDRISVQKNREHLSKILDFPPTEWACSVQVHDAEIVKVNRHMTGRGVFDYKAGIKDCDGFYTNETNLLLTLCYADCVPLYFYAPSHQLIGIAHAGWRGSVKDIGGRLVKAWIEQEGVKCDEIYAAIGPSISSCCYVVDDQVITLIDNIIADETPKPYSATSKDLYSLDLKRLNQLLLLQAGIPIDQIVVSHYCTSCEEQLFFSHRRDKGKTGRMMSYIGMKEE